jgi:hypothetical protein
MIPWSLSAASKAVDVSVGGGADWEVGSRIFKSMGVERQCPDPESAVEIPRKIVLAQ